MKRLTFFLLLLLFGTWSIAHALSVFIVPQGGTGQSTFTASQLLYGNGTAALSSVATTSLTAGTNITFTGTPGYLVGGTNLTIAATGNGTVSTSSIAVVGNLPYWTSAGFPSLLGNVATTSVSCTGNTTCTAFTAIGSGAITINSTGGGTGLSTTSPLSAGNLLEYSSAGAGATFGIATTTLTGNNGLTLSASNGYLVGGSNATIGLASIAAGVLGSAITGVPASLATSTLYGAASTGGYVLQWSNTANGLVLAATSSSATPGGTISQVQYNGAGSVLAGVSTTTLTFTSFPANIPTGYGALVGGSNTTFTWWGLSTTTQPAGGNILASNGNSGVYGVSTTTANCVSGVTCTGFNVLGGSNPSFSLASMSAGVLGSVTSAVPTSQATSTLYGAASVGGYVLQWSNTANGLVLAATSSSGTGTVTSITAGAGLLGGTITTTGTLYGQVGTSSIPTIGQVPYWTGLGSATAPATLTSIATSTLTITGPFNVPTNQGYLVGPNNSSITFWGLSTTTQPAGGNVLASNGNSGVYGVATSSATCGTGVTCTGFNVLGGSNPSFALATMNAGVLASNLNGTAPASISTSTLFGGTTPGYVWSYQNGAWGAYATSTGGGAGTVTSITAGDGLLGGTITTSGTLYGQVGTTTLPVISQIPYWSSLGTATAPAKLASVATTSESCGTGISCAAHDVLTGGGTIKEISYLATSSAETISNLAYWTTTSGTPAQLGKVATSTITLSAPFTGTITGLNGNGVSNTFSYWGLATTTQPAISNLLESNGAAGVFGVATTSETCTSPITCTAYDVLTGGGAITLGTVTVGKGGTGITTVADGAILMGGISGGTTNLTALATTTPSAILIENFGTGRPSWVATSTLNVAISDTTGTLLVARGGTGDATFTVSQLLYGNGTNALSSVATTSIICSGFLTCTGFNALGSASTITTTGLLAVASGGTNASTFTAGSVVFAGASGTYTQKNANFFWDNTNFRLGLGTTTPFNVLNVASTSASTGAFGQLLLTDNNGGTNLKHWLLSSEGGDFYLSTTSDAFATTTPSAFVIRGSGAPSLSIGSTTLTVSAINGLITQGSNGANGSSTMSVGKWQIDGYNSAGTRQCAYVVGTTWTFTAGACNP